MRWMSEKWIFLFRRAKLKARALEERTLTSTQIKMDNKWKWRRDRRL